MYPPGDATGHKHYNLSVELVYLSHMIETVMIINILHSITELYMWSKTILFCRSRISFVATGTVLSFQFSF